MIQGIVLAGVLAAWLDATAPGSAVRNFPLGIRIIAIHFGDDGIVGMGTRMMQGKRAAPDINAFAY
jgi:hypothetical protein